MAQKKLDRLRNQSTEHRNLERQAIQVAGDPATRIFPIVRPSHDVSDVLLFERLFRLSDHADFGNGVNLVVILPPGPQHAGLVRAAIAAGKDVYCEWPLTTTVADTEDLLNRAEKAGVRHAVGLQRTELKGC